MQSKIGKDNKEITFVINSLKGGGAQNVSITVANKLSEIGYQIDFITFSLKNSRLKDKLSENINLIDFKCIHSRNSVVHFLGYIKNRKPKTFFVFNHQVAAILVILRFFISYKYSIIARNISILSEKQKIEPSLWHKFFVYNLVKLVYKKTDKIIAQSDEMKNNLTQYFKIKPDNIVVINNPVKKEIEDYMKLDWKEEIAKENEILYVGRLSKVKGLEYLVEAFKKINSEYPEMILRIIGEGEEEENLRNLIQKVGLEQNVIIDGYQNNIIPYYLKAKVTILTSLYEGFPNVLIESITLGTPVVSFDCESGPREIIEEGVNGFLVKPFDSDTLAGKVLYIIKNNFKIKPSKTYFIEHNINLYCKTLN